MENYSNDLDTLDNRFQVYSRNNLPSNRALGFDVHAKPFATDNNILFDNDTLIITYNYYHNYYMS